MNKYELHTEDDYFVDFVHANTLEEALDKLKLKYKGVFYIFYDDKFTKINLK